MTEIIIIMVLYIACVYLANE